MSAQFGLSIMVMAAGGSRRFNGVKQLAEINGRTLLQSSIDKLNDVDAVQKLLVLGHAHDDIMNKLRLHHTWQVVQAQHWQLGLGHSISQGCHHIADNITHILVLLADQVALTQQHLETLIQRARRNPDKIICAEYDNHIGVPAIFPVRYLEQLKMLQGDTGAKALLQNEPHLTQSIPDAAIDIDTQEQLAYWQQENRTNHDHI